MNMEIICICGKLCSGKTTLADQIEQSVNRDGFAICKNIEVSSIVKQLINSSSREQLQKTAHLEGSIISELSRQIYQAEKLNYRQVNITGIRQPTILKSLLSQYDNVTAIWLECSYDVRKNRYITRANEKDSSTEFNIADSRDVSLGINELKQLIFNGQ